MLKTWFGGAKDVSSSPSSSTSRLKFRGQFHHLGPSPGYKHILVALDKFTKCIEVRSVARVTSKEAAWFMEYITHRFGVSNRIVTDLGKAFTWSDF
jgi:hypothetical protein